MSQQLKNSKKHQAEKAKALAATQPLPTLPPISQTVAGLRKIPLRVRTRGTKLSLDDL